MNPNGEPPVNPNNKIATESSGQAMPVGESSSIIGAGNVLDIVPDAAATAAGKVVDAPSEIPVSSIDQPKVSQSGPETSQFVTSETVSPADSDQSNVSQIGSEKAPSAVTEAVPSIADLAEYGKVFGSEATTVPQPSVTEAPPASTNLTDSGQPLVEEVPRVSPVTPPDSTEELLEQSQQTSPITEDTSQPEQTSEETLPKLKGKVVTALADYFREADKLIAKDKVSA
jgi:hypothetical protein